MWSAAINKKSHLLQNEPREAVSASRLTCCKRRWAPLSVINWRWSNEVDSTCDGPRSMEKKAEKSAEFRSLDKVPEGSTLVLRRPAFKQQLRRPVFCSCRTTSVEHVASTATAL